MGSTGVNDLGAKVGGVPQNSGARRVRTGAATKFVVSGGIYHPPYLKLYPLSGLMRVESPLCR